MRFEVRVTLDLVGDEFTQVKGSLRVPHQQKAPPLVSTHEGFERVDHVAVRQFAVGLERGIEQGAQGNLPVDRRVGSAHGGVSRGLIQRGEALLHVGFEVCVRHRVGADRRVDVKAVESRRRICRVGLDLRAAVGVDDRRVDILATDVFARRQVRVAKPVVGAGVELRLVVHKWVVAGFARALLGAGFRRWGRAVRVRARSVATRRSKQSCRPQSHQRNPSHDASMPQRPRTTHAGARR